MVVGEGGDPPSRALSVSVSLSELSDRSSSRKPQSTESPRSFISSLGCNWCRPEWLSMYFCFAGDKGFRQSDFDNFDANLWVKAAAELLLEHQVRGPHLALIAQRARILR